MMAVFSLEKGFLFSKREEVSVRRGPDILHLVTLSRVSLGLAQLVVLSDLGKALAVLHDKEREPEAAD